MILLAILGLVLVLGSFYIIFRQECPRVILGYDCKGEDCDHSETTRQQALYNMQRSKRDDDDEQL